MGVNDLHSAAQVLYGGALTTTREVPQMTVTATAIANAATEIIAERVAEGPDDRLMVPTRYNVHAAYEGARAYTSDASTVVVRMSGVHSYLAGEVLDAACNRFPEDEFRAAHIWTDDGRGARLDLACTCPMEH